MKKTILTMLLAFILVITTVFIPYQAMAESVQSMTADELEAYIAYLQIVLQNKRKEEGNANASGAVQAVTAPDEEEIKVDFNGQLYSGTYEGELRNNKPHGSGTFEGENRGNRLVYTGQWADGKMAGTGTVEADWYLLHFDAKEGSYDRTGSYAGEVLNGLPEGEGTFITTRGERNPWKYTGQWKNGMFNGQGTQTIEDSATVKKGTFTNNEFTPDALEAFAYTAQKKEYNISEKSKTAVKKFADYFTGKQKQGIPTEQHIDTKFDLKQYKKRPNDYGDKLVYVSKATVVQVITWEIGNKTVEQILMETDDNDVYYGFYCGKSNIVEDMKIAAYVLPFDWDTYKNVNNNDVWAMFCAITDYVGDTNSISAPAISDYTKANVGDTIRYGKLRWKVLAKEKNRILVTTETCVESRAYHSKSMHVTWEKCDLRKWLNDEFYHSSFSENEKKAISVVKNNNGGKDPYGVKVKNGKTTKDRIFILKYEEAKKYYNLVANDNKAWWTRTPDNWGSNYLFSASEWKNEEYTATEVDNTMGVRPAMWLSI